MRTDDADQLNDDPMAFALLARIARRANWHDRPNPAGLGFGQAYIGNPPGMTPKQYRCAKERLARSGLATFKAFRGRGTIATLADDRVFSIRDGRKRQKEGDFRGDLFSEGKTQKRAISRAISRRFQGDSGAINEEEITKEEENPFAATAAGAGESSSSLPTSSRLRNPLIDALAQVEGIPLNEIGAAGSRLGKALSIIRQSTPDVSPGEILRRARNYPLHFRDVPLTAMALAKNWGKCHASPSGASRADYDEEMERMGFSKEERL